MKRKIEFRPKLMDALRSYSKEKFAADFMAGIIVGIVALPLAIAFGIASGVSPAEGLITAIIGGFIVALLGGTNVQIGGPTGAFIVIVYGIVADPELGLPGLAMATIFAGLILILMGLLHLGTVIRFIPYPIVVGFTSGIALTIFSTQINDLLGLGLTGLPGNFLAKWGVYFHNFDKTDLVAVGLSALSILLIIFTPKVLKKIPGSLVAIIVVTLLAYVLREHCGVQGIATIGDNFPNLNAEIHLRGFDIPGMDQINKILPSAFTIAILGAIESLLSATVVDGITGDKHDSNTELVAQGAANLVVPFFGGIPVTGAIARTMTNINNGGRTPVAGIVHAVVLLLIMLFLIPLAKHIPMACLAGVLVMVSYNMSGWRTFGSLLKNSKSDVIVLLVTFFLTVIFDLTIAIEIGLLLAMLLFMRRMSETTRFSVATEKLDLSNEGEIPHMDEKLDLKPGIEVYEIDGPFFCGGANRFDEVMNLYGTTKPKVRIIRMRKVPFMDTTGLHNMESLFRLSNKEGIRVILSGVNEKVRRVLQKSDIYEAIGERNVCDNIHEAIAVANSYLD